jgi:hypothetical protein
MHVVGAMILSAGLFACESEGLGRSVAPPRSSRSVSERRADVQAIATWNIIALKTTAAGPFSPPRETRSLAIVSGAVNDAV